MYETLVEDVKAEIELKTFNGPTCTIKGWAFSNKFGVCPIKCKWDGSTKSIVVNARSDICEKFNRKTIVLCGWEVEVPVNKYYELQIKLGTEWTSFVNFDTNVLPITTTPAVAETSVQEKMSNEIVVPAPKKEHEFEEYISNALSDFFKKNPDATPETTKVLKIGFSFAARPHKDIIVVDNFYQNIDEVREFSLASIGSKEIMPNFVKTIPAFKEQFEAIMGQRLTFDTYSNNGELELTIAGNNSIIGVGDSQYGAVLFLTPNAPVVGGITLYRSRRTGKMTISEAEKDKVFQNGNLDTTEFEPVDVIGNVYNRLVIFNTQLIHGVSHMFGCGGETGRLVQKFAFDVEDTTKISVSL
jgi:hypothetical protein